MMEQIASFGYWIRRRRKALDLTQDELAQRVGCAVVTLRKIEADERRPSKEFAEQLADALELDTPEWVAFLKVARAELAVDQLAEPTARLVATIRPSVRLHQGSVLPAPLTPLIGRRREVAAVVDLLHCPDVRLVTLLGPGGIGKTRLSLQVAAELRDAFAQRAPEGVRDGIFFVSLAPIADPALVIPSIAQTLGVQESSAQPLLASLKVHLHAKQILLVLDNFEQVIGAAPCVAELLEAAPKLKVLATSRAVLRLSGEHEFPVPPLPLPDLQHVPPLPDLRQNEAVQLFVERARAIQPDFALTGETAPAVAEICHRLDGLPLAIELAAARTRLLSLPGILQRLDQRLKILTGGAQNLPARHQTLRGAIDWSYNLLSAEEQVLLVRLAVFVGGWTLDAAAAIAGPHGSQPIDILDSLESLVAKSLVRRQPEETQGTDSTPRFDMFETIREYALERLEVSGEADAVRSRHLMFFRDLATERQADLISWSLSEPSQAEPHLKRAAQSCWLNRLEVEHPNIRAALAWSLKCGARDDGLRLATAIHWFWHLRGHDREAYQWMQRFLADSREVAPATQARALPAAAFFAQILGDRAQATAWADEGAGLSRETGEQRSLAHALVLLGWMEPDAERGAVLFDQALDVARALGDSWWSAAALWYKSDSYARQDDERAQALMEESLPLFRCAGDTWATGWVLAELAEIDYRRGRYDRAAMLFEESLALTTAVGHSAGIADALHGLGVIARDQGEYVRAAALLDEGLERFREAGHPSLIARLLCAQATVALSLGDAERATILLEEACAHDQNCGIPTRNARALHLLGLVARAQGNVERAGELLKESLVWTPAGAFRDIIESLEGLAVLAATREHAPDGDRPGALYAVRLLGAAAGAREATGIALPPADRAAYERDVAAIRAQLDEAMWRSAWAEGRAMMLEQAIAYALEQEAALPKQPPTMTVDAQPPPSSIGIAPAPAAELGALTPREREVLRFVAQGLRTAEVAVQLRVSPLTVNVHLRAIYRKLHVSSRTAAARVAHDLQLV